MKIKEQTLSNGCVTIVLESSHIIKTPLQVGIEVESKSPRLSLKSLSEKIDGLSSKIKALEIEVKKNINEKHNEMI